jgi:hypothetical protein
MVVATRLWLSVVWGAGGYGRKLQSPVSIRIQAYRNGRD